MDDFEAMKQALNAQEGFTSHNGIRVLSIEKGLCRCGAEVTPTERNPHHIAHGGLLFALCDTAAGVAATTLGRSVVSRSADFHFLHPATGRITAEGRVVTAGLHMAYCTAEVYDEAGTLLAAGGFEMFYINEPLKTD